MEYKLSWDLHTHTVFSHGKGTIEQNVASAAAKGLAAVGIADHGIGHAFFGMRDEEAEVMRLEIERLRPLYPEMRILFGTEANVINRSGSLDVPTAVPLDYLIAGYHFGAFGEEPGKAFGLGLLNRTHVPFETLKNANTDRVLAALYTNKITILSHPGAKAPVDLLAVADAARETGTLMEINAKHLSLKASDLRKLKETGVRFCIGSDAHTPAEIGRMDGPLKIVLDAGIDPASLANVVPLEAKITKGDLPEWMLLS